MRTPAIVGAILQLGRCFDLMDSRFTDELPYAFDMLQHEEQGTAVPENAGATPDKLLRLVEGGPAFESSGIHHRSHVQIAVRNPACVIGIFRPRMQS